jgi:hypothetical protein
MKALLTALILLAATPALAQDYRIRPTYDGRGYRVENYDYRTRQDNGGTWKPSYDGRGWNYEPNASGAPSVTCRPTYDGRGMNCTQW